MISSAAANNWNNLCNDLIPDEWLEDEPAVTASSMDQVVLGGFAGEEKNVGSAGALVSRSRFVFRFS